MGEHPERIWVTGVERYIGFDRITASSLDHSGAGEGYGYPEYVRADLYDALHAQVEAMLEYRRADMREAYEAGYNTRKVGAGLAEGWATYSAKLHKTGSPDGRA